MSQPQLTSTPWAYLLDKCGIFVSALCAIHCLLLPVLLPLLPLIASSFVAQEWFERTILLGSLAIGALAMLYGYARQHGSLIPLVLLLLGGGIYWFKDIFGDNLEPVMVVVGAALIVIGHIRNMRLAMHGKDTHSHTVNLG